MAKYDEEAFKDANLLAGDSILNYRTIASFAHDEVIINQYDAYLEIPLKKATKDAHFIAISFGFSQFV
jgi:ABC-type transport system involved in Fe-S cluster assembly fused permease/ATPase subunit